MRLAVYFIVVALAALLWGCGPLPRPGSFGGAIGVLPVSANMTGLVLSSTDDLYTSTDVYFYNFLTGQLSPLATGESGDVLIKWDRQRLWVFNRAAGRGSYSWFSPKLGPSSRSTERRTPQANAYDPFDILGISDSETILSMQSSSKLTVANLLTGQASDVSLDSVDTGKATIPFRPSHLVEREGVVLAFHQALDSSWQAVGGGRVYYARRNANLQWNWVDQNVTTSGIQGVILNVSNPVSVFDCEGASCFVAGACYATMGNNCIDGVDELNWQTKTVTHLFDLPTGYESAGAIVPGLKAGDVIACLKSPSEQTAKIVMLEARTGKTSASWDSGAAFCGPFEVDRNGGRVFVTKTSDQKSDLFILDAQLQQLSKISLGIKVSNFEAVDE